MYTRFSARFDITLQKKNLLVQKEEIEKNEKTFSSYKRVFMRNVGMLNDEEWMIY